MSSRTVSELEQMLRDRSVSVQIFSSKDACFVVWLYAEDDPELGVFPGEGGTLDEALAEAFDSWDQKRSKPS